MNEHDCRCRKCAAEAFPTSRVRLSEGHIAVHFGDNQPSRGPLAVSLNGADVSKETFEALAGTAGWAIQIRQPAHRCRCYEGMCEYTAYGVVRVERKRLEAAV